jgi:hypothetical protein
MAMPKALAGHQCNAYCDGTQHCDLVYTSLDNHVALAKQYAAALHVDVVRIKPATEAEDLEQIPETQRQLLVGSTALDGQRFLVWWQLPAGRWVPPSTAELRARGIGNG